MAKNKVKYIKPGRMAQQVPEYEKLRREKILFNNMRIQAMGFQKMADSLVDPYKKRKAKNTKEASAINGDDEYQPSGDEDNEDEDNDDSYSDEEGLTSTPAQESPVLSHTQGLAPNSVAAPTPTQESPVEQNTVSTEAGSLPQHMVRATISRKKRGITRGINTERLAKANDGKLLVEVPQEVGAPVGENAKRFATWLGVQIRTMAPLKDFEKWDDIPSTMKAPILQATRDIFDIVEYDEKEQVRRDVDRKCKKIYRTWRHKMKEHYEALLKDGKDPYTKPFRGVKGEDWAWMIGNIWTNKDKEELIEKRKKARAEVPFNHSMGSKSFPAAMSTETKEHDGQHPHIAEFYKLTHYNEKKKKWVSPICEQLHVQLETRRQEDVARREEEQVFGLPVTIPQEEMPIEIHGKKFYVKEYGVGLKRPSKKSHAKSHDEVRVLKNQVQALTDMCQEQKNQFEEQKNQFENLKNLCQTQQETICAYDERFARFDAVMSAYMNRAVGAISNSEFGNV